MVCVVVVFLHEETNIGKQSKRKINILSKKEFKSLNDAKSKENKNAFRLERRCPACIEREARKKLLLKSTLNLIKLVTRLRLVSRRDACAPVIKLSFSFITNAIQYSYLPIL